MDREIEETLCAMQAQLCAQRVALRAIARTHPDPVALLAGWREALGDASTWSPVMPAPVRHSEYLADQMRVFAEDITAELVEFAVPVTAGAPKGSWSPGEPR